MSGACGINREKRMNTGFWLGNMNEIANLEDLGIGA
jgi:hypothetical protein